MTAKWIVGLLLTTQAARAEVPVLSVCEALANLAVYNGKAVIIVGLFDHSTRSSWLDQDCSQPLQTGAYLWDNHIAVNDLDLSRGPAPIKPPNFHWNQALLDRMQKHIATTTHVGSFDQWAAVFGRFETRLPLTLVPGIDGHPRGSGYGHGHLDPAQIVAGPNSFLELQAR